MLQQAKVWALRGVVVAGLVGAIVFGWSERDRFAPVTVGDPVPAYAAPSIDGDTVSLDSLRGNVVLVNIWATWCAPCRWEMPALNRLHRELRGRGFEVVAVSVDAAPIEEGGRDAVGAMVRDLGLEFRVLRDPNAEVQRLFGVTGLPTSFLIDRDGVIVDRVLGPARWDEPPFAERIRELLEG